MLTRICGSRSFNKIVTKTNSVLWKSRYNAYCYSLGVKTSGNEHSQMTSNTKKPLSRVLNSRSPLMSIKLANQSLFSKAYILAGSMHFSTAIQRESKVEGVMNNFLNFDHQPDVMEISSVLNDLNRLTMSLEEFQNYLPFIEEVADVAAR